MRTWKRTLLPSLALALLASCAGAPSVPAAAAAPATIVRPERWSVPPVQAWGRLQVCGTQICSQRGKPVQLRGMSLFWSNSGWGGERFYDAAVVDELADGWHATVVRAALGFNENGGYFSNPVANEARVRAVIDAAVARGMYVIVDWHSHSLFKDEAVAFFSAMAKEYAKVPNIIWEPFNEPVKQSWSRELKPYHQAVIAAIRAAGSKNLVVVGSPTWSQDVDVAADDPITGDANVAYALHFYAGSHHQALRDKADLARKRGAAVFVTEWGTCAASGDGGFDPVASKAWTDWLDEHGISSLNWALNDKRETASALHPGTRAVGPWGAGQLTDSGRWARAYVLGGYR
jgi:endoglucanase